MASYSSILNEDKNNNRSDTSKMNNIDQKYLARLRPEKFDDAAVKEQISLIQQACGDVDPEIIALVFHECDYNIQQTISRIQAGDFEDGEWQTAKSNHKKKSHNTNYNLGDQILNGGTLSDSERSLSQRTSPTSSLRDGRHRNDYYQYSSSIRTNTGRRGGNDSVRNQYIPSNSRYPPRTKSINKPVSSSKTTNAFQQIPSEISSPAKQLNEDIPQITSSSRDEYEFVDDTIQSLSFNNSQKKTSFQSSSKRRIPSIIPQEPVSMHPTVQFSTEPIDIQFGDVQWNDSIPIAVSPSNSVDVSSAFDNHEQEISSIINTQNHEQNQDDHDILSSNYIHHKTTNETDNQLLETTNQLSSSLSITDNTIANNLSVVPPEGTSHLSDQLTDTSSPVAPQYSSQQQASIQVPITRLPPSSTPRTSEYTSPTSQFIPNTIPQNNNGATSSAFTPINVLGNYSSIPRDYTQTATNWNPQSSNYKTTSKSTMIPTGTYPQQTSYPLPSQQQQIFVGTYPYPALSPALVQVFAPFEHWPTSGFPTSVESYPYATTNYIPAYPNQQQSYHPPTKYDHYPYDKEFFAHYGQPRSSNSDISYQQQQQQQQQQSSTPTQSTKDTHITSKLSPTAAAFSQGASLTASPSATALYFNPVPFPMPNYFPSIGGTTHQDRTLSYSSVDNRDNRNGASYGNTNNRNNYYYGQQPQQQRTHNNNVSNSTWHLQQ